MDEGADDIVQLQADFLRNFATRSSHVVEVGSGGIDLAERLAPFVSLFTSIEAIHPKNKLKHDNISLIESCMPPYEIESETVDVAFTSHFIEHLHPEDAELHIEEMYRILKKGGKYICVTPNRHYGPFDSSRLLNLSTPKGLHLKEYTHEELYHLLKKYRFKKVLKGSTIGNTSTIDLYISISIDKIFSVLPYRSRKSLLNFISNALNKNEPFRLLEQLIMVGIK